MPTLNASIEIEDIMEALDMVELPAECRFKGTDSIRLDVEVRQGEIDENASEEDPEMIPADEGDLREGLQAILVGDIAMGRTLLCRALEHDTGATRVIEEALRGA